MATSIDANDALLVVLTRNGLEALRKWQRRNRSSDPAIIKLLEHDLAIPSDTIEHEFTVEQFTKIFGNWTEQESRFRRILDVKRNKWYGPSRSAYGRM